VLDELREAVAEAGLDPEAIEMHEVTTDESAMAEHFVGSPTIRIDGKDIQPPADEEPFGLTCRIYRLRSGRISPTPDPADLRDAIRHAKGASRNLRRRA
jgi:hypothetical protein